MERVAGYYEEYLRDESRKSGNAETISFPVNMEQVQRVLSEINAKEAEVTVQGSRTGVAAGAVPMQGHILNLERMNKVTGMGYDVEENCFYLNVQPGLALSKLREMIAEKSFGTDGWDKGSLDTLEIFRQTGEWFFPPDPTETSASIGGMAACNASGARSYFYGPTRNYIEALEIVMADTSILRLRRKQNLATGLQFSLVSDDGKTYAGELPGYSIPKVKNAAGYHVHSGMELIDLFIGSEGTLGIITTIKLKLIHKPDFIWGMTAFISTEASALDFIQKVRTAGNAATKEDNSFKPVAMEYFNLNALEMLRDAKKNNDAFSEIPEIPKSGNVAVYVEFHGDSEDEVCDMAMKATEILEICGGSGDHTWLASSPAEMERMHYFRHAIPETVNLAIDIQRKKDPGLSKLGTDMAVPDDRLEDVMDMYNKGLAEEGLHSVIFGHIGNNHLHVNIIPHSMEEYARGRALYQEWAKKVVEMGGTISAEHGTGKLKTALLRQMYGEEGIQDMKKLKEIFDPKCLLNRGNLFDFSE